MDNNQELVIVYSHYIPLHCKNQDGEMDGDYYEKCQIKIPFQLFYPVCWMKDLFENDKSLITGFCNSVTGFAVDFNELKDEYSFATREIYEAYLKDNYTVASECKNCFAATVSYCDRIYNEMLNKIRRSIVESLLCLKDLNIQKDLRKVIGKMIWNTRHEIVWFRLNNKSK